MSQIEKLYLILEMRHSDTHSYLKSPIVALHVGSGDTATQLTAHQALLIKSPFFAEAIAPDSASPVSPPP